MTTEFFREEGEEGEPGDLEEEEQESEEELEEELRGSVISFDVILGTPGTVGCSLSASLATASR